MVGSIVIFSGLNTTDMLNYYTIYPLIEVISFDIINFSLIPDSITDFYSLF